MGSTYQRSTPSKNNHSKTPTGKYLVPHKRIIILNTNGIKQRETPDKEYPGIQNLKGDPSWRQKELIPKYQRENYNEDPSWRQKELIPMCQRRQKGIPEMESPGIFNPKGDPSWYQKEAITRCQRDNSNVDPSWRQKE